MTSSSDQQPAQTAPIVPSGALTTREAHALGVTRGELAGRRWRAPLRGVQVPAGPGADLALQRIHEVAELLPPGAAIGGWAAAHLLGAAELDGGGRDGRGREPVPVVLPPPLSIRRRSGLRLWRSALEPGAVVQVDGIACTCAIRTGFDLARHSRLPDGVVALDVLGRRLGLAPGDVLAHARSHRRWRGLPMLRRAVRLSDPRARSPGETRLRLIWVVDAGLPVPEVNPDVLDHDGHLLGTVDLLDPACGLVGEYDGAHHRDAEAHALDNAREEWLEHAGLVVVRAGNLDVARDRRRTVLRLQTAWRRAAARDRSRDRWTHRPLLD